MIRTDTDCDKCEHKKYAKWQIDQKKWLNT